MNVIASVLCASTLAACAVASPSAPRGNDGKSCADWETLNQKDRIVVIGSALEQKVGRPTDSKLAACLWGIVDLIADHATEICAQRGGSFDAAVGVAFRSAIDFCQTKSS